MFQSEPPLASSWFAKKRERASPPESIFNRRFPFQPDSNSSRHVDGGGVGDWSFVRRALSRGAQFVGLVTLPRVVGRVSDPMSGYFIVRRNAISGIEMSPLGYKILLEVLGRGRIRSVAEVGYVFSERVAGTSKVTSRVYLEYLAHLLRLRFTTMGSGANPNGALARHLPAAAYATVIAFAAYSILKAPAYNWDLIPYVGAVLSADANSASAPFL